MLDGESLRRISDVVRENEIATHGAIHDQDRRPEDQTFARTKIFAVPEGGTWEEVAGDKWRLVDCQEVIKTSTATWAATTYRPLQTIWFIPEMFGADDQADPNDVLMAAWLLCVWDFQSERWVVSASRGCDCSGSGSVVDCCGSCGDSVSEWIDNFQTYQDTENLTVYGYTATVPGNPSATNYTGSLIGVWLGSVTHLDPIKISRPFSIDCLKYSRFSFEAKLYALDAFGLAEFSFDFSGVMGGPFIPVKIVGAKVLGTTVQFSTTNGSATSVSHTFAANDVFKIEFDIDSHEAVRTDGIAFEMEITTRGLINGVEVYSGTGTLSSKLDNYCNANFGVTEGSLGRGDTVTDMWVFKAIPI